MYSYDSDVTEDVPPVTSGPSFSVITDHRQTLEYFNTNSDQKKKEMFMKGDEKACRFYIKKKLLDADAGNLKIIGKIIATNPWLFEEFCTALVDVNPEKWSDIWKFCKQGPILVKSTISINVTRGTDIEEVS